MCLQWEYLPLIDNEPEDTFQYGIAVFTAIGSSKHLTSTVYITIEGEDGTTSTRVLKTDYREVQWTNDKKRMLLYFNEKKITFLIFIFCFRTFKVARVVIFFSPIENVLDN